MKKEIKLIFRKGNKLASSAINASMCPLGDINNSIMKFETFLSDQSDKIRTYFEKMATEGERIALEKYHRPITRGRDGHLYSAAEMDRAMMGYSY